MLPFSKPNPARVPIIILVAIFIVFVVTRAASFELRTVQVQPRRTSLSTSRRDVLSSIVVPAGIIALVAAPPKKAFANDQQAANASSQNNNYQGVYSDPNHPKGHRILYGNDKVATLKLADEPNGKVYELPLRITTDKQTNGVQLAFDFSSKGGPSDAVGVLGSSSSDDAADGAKKTIRFPDGNVWTEVTQSIAGVYNDAQNGYTVTVRQWKGSELKVELVDGSSSETIASFGAKAGSRKAFFEYPGEFNKAGFIDTEEKTITFRDGIVWTRY